MREYHTEMETYEKKVLDRVICDWCGEEFKNRRGAYSTRDFDFSFTEGHNYGNDGGNEEGWAVEDMCDDCVEKLCELLIDNGINVSNVDIGW